MNKIEKKNPFKVPDNYFETVNRKIISAASATPSVELKKVSYRRLNQILAVAASLAVFILLSYTAMKVLIPGSGNNIQDISREEFSEFDLNDVDIPTLEIYVDQTFLDNNETSNLSKAEIIDYLLIENIDLSEIYERL